MKNLFVILLFLISTSIFSQNIQLHYDFGEDREHFTSTIEMFKPDNYGATFFFVDFDYNAGGNKSINLAYFEFARYFKIPGLKNISPTIQYNDGTAPWGRLGPIWLAGAQYSMGLGKGFVNLELLYRNDYLAVEKSNVQFTTSWFYPLFDGKVAFSGFLDLWTGEYWYTDGSEFVLLTEPQLWYHAWEHLHLGGEVEISNNFLPGTDGIQVKPTLGIKWVF